MSTVPASTPLPVGRLVGVGSVVFFANAALLVLQLVAGRLLAPFIGSSLETWTSIIGVFLAGIALGNAFGGKLADRYPTPRTLAALLAVGAVAALWMLVFPMLLASTGLHKALPLGPRIPILAAALCLPAGFVLSLLTPLAIKLGLPDVAHTGRVSGLIFALSTLGCLIGNYVTGFYLIPTFTINTLVVASAVALLALAGGSLLLVKGAEPTPPAPLPEGKGEEMPPHPTGIESAPAPSAQSWSVWLKPLLLTAALFAATIVVEVVTDFWVIGWIVVLTTALWAALDSSKLELRKYVGIWGGPVGVFLWINLLWPVFFPMYLVTRTRRLAGELPLRTQHRVENLPGGERGSTSSLINPHAFSDIRRAYLIVFLASFCGMALELTASRVLAQQLGVSLFTWTGIIGVMLAGTALGNFAGGQLADRPRVGFAWLAGAAVLLGTAGVATALALMTAYDRDTPVVEDALGIAPRNWAKYRLLSDAEFVERRWEVAAFYADARPAALPAFQRTVGAGAAAGVALGALLAYFVVGAVRRERPGPGPSPRVALAAALIMAGAATVFLFVAMALITMHNLFDTWGAIPQVMTWTFSMFFLPMFMLGLVSPQVIRLAVPDVAHAGRVAGRVYAWSTGGAIAGTFAAGYVLLSAIGMFHTILAVALALTLTSLLVVNIWKETQAGIKADDAANAGAGALLYLFSIVLGGITGGFILAGRSQKDGTIAQVESDYYTIRVARATGYKVPNTALAMHLDHLLHSVVDPYDPMYLYYEHEHTQVEFLRLARAGAAEPRALVIGGGGYTFPRYAMEAMPEAHVDVVEIDPKVTRVARDHLNLQPYANLHAYHMDGRQYVAERAAPGSYDLVIQDAVNDLSVPAHLMTKEYNDAVKAALKPGGVYLLTIIDSLESGKLWKAAMATLAKTFPEKNVVLLTAKAIPEAGTPDGDHWDRTRQVLVIYASDRPFSPEAMRAAVVDQLGPWFTAGVTFGAAIRGDFAAFPLMTVADPLARVGTPVHTMQVPAARLEPFTAREPGVVLTDQFCPVDNLMAEVFRNRNK